MAEYLLRFPSDELYISGNNKKTFFIYASFKYELVIFQSFLTLLNFVYLQDDTQFNIFSNKSSCS